MAIFSVDLSRTTVLPQATTRPLITSFRFVTGGLVFVTATLDSRETAVVGVSWPSLREEVRFRFADFVLDLAHGDGSLLYYTDPGGARFAEVLELDRSTGSARRLGRIRDQLIRHPTSVGAGLAFVSSRISGKVVARRANGAFATIVDASDIQSVASCGQDLVVARLRGGGSVIDRIDRAGKVTRLSAGPLDGEPGCSPDGRTLYYLGGATGEVRRCDQDGCGSVVDRPAMRLSVSPDGRRLALLSLENRGPIVWWISQNGGEIHEVGESETGCRPGWATPTTLWISRRRGRALVWTEVDAGSGVETGNVRPGTRECTDGRADPATPVDPDIRLNYYQTSQIRLLPAAYLRHG